MSRESVLAARLLDRTTVRIFRFGVFFYPACPFVNVPKRK
jgi:hypothetical protein